MRKIIITMLAFALMITSMCMLGITTSQAASIPTVRYQTHVQDIGWQGWKTNGESAGTSGQSLRLEGMYIDIDGVDNAIEYRTHVQNIGWQNWVNEGAMTGTSGQSLRLEAIEIRLKGSMADQHDIYYRVHAQNFGWMDWAKNGQSAGTAGYSYRLEAIQIVLVAKGGSAPGPMATPFKDAKGNTSIAVKYRTHVQDIGWQGWKSNGETAGTSGQSLRLEGMYIEIDGADNAVEYRTHVQNIGWQNWVNEGDMTGTNGRSLRLEAIEIRLKGDMATRYDVYYRVHAQDFGWMDWAKNGQSAGTAGYSYRLEAIQIKLVAKGGSAPGSMTTPFKDASEAGYEYLPDEYAQAVCDGVNWKRVNNGRYSTDIPVTLDPRMCEQAREHALKMAKAEDIFHSGLGYAESVTSGASPNNGEGEGAMAAVHAPSLLDPDVIYLGAGAVKARNGKIYLCVMGSKYLPK